jgi:hypothetical protein
LSIPTAALDVELSVTKAADRFSFAYRHAGVDTWTFVGTRSVTTPPLFVGLFAKDWSTPIPLTVDFDYLRVTPAATPSPAAYAPGTVVALAHTPHLWVVDDRGSLHWGGDTRALSGRSIRWDQRAEVTLDRLLGLPLGDPWLSAGLLKDGAPIYLVKWETADASPSLLHIQSIADVQLFGINSGNYGVFVVDKIAWEARFGFRADQLSRSELAPATP